MRKDTPTCGLINVMGTYDALLVVSFGGPEGPDDVMPFLENVTRGRGVPPRATAGGRRALPALRRRQPDQRAVPRPDRGAGAELRRTASTCPSTGATATGTPSSTTRSADGRRRRAHGALAFVTSRLRSYSGCRQYREDIARAQGEAVGRARRRSTSSATSSTTPASSSPWSTAPVEALDRVARRHRDARPAGLHRAQHPDRDGPHRPDSTGRATSAAPSGGSWPSRGAGRRREWDLVWQSRSGPPQIPWLEPDVCDHLRLPRPTRPRWCSCPLGFVSDHMEVVYDLDAEAAEVAGKARPPAGQGGHRGHPPAVRLDGRRAAGRAGADHVRGRLLPGSAPPSRIEQRRSPGRWP